MVEDLGGADERLARRVSLLDAARQRPPQEPCFQVQA